jgi:hypothetical protein
MRERTVTWRLKGEPEGPGRLPFMGYGTVNTRRHVLTWIRCYAAASECHVTAGELLEVLLSLRSAQKPYISN